MTNLDRVKIEVLPLRVMRVDTNNLTITTDEASKRLVNKKLISAMFLDGEDGINVLYDAKHELRVKIFVTDALSRFAQD